MKKLRAKLILAVFLFSAFSQCVIAEPENWYMYLALGLANSQYPSAWEAEFSRVNAEAESSLHINSARELGVYFPIALTSAWGILLEHNSDSISNTAQGGSFGIDTIMLGPSYCVFNGKEFGDGLFVRGDAGYATGSSIGVSDSASLDFGHVGSGYGYQLAAGIGKTTGPSNRIVLGINHQRLVLDGDHFNTSRIFAGVIF